MSFRLHPAPTGMLFGYDPIDLPPNHLVWLVERVVDEALQHATPIRKKGQPAYDPRLCAKVLIYGYATGIRSSRQLQRLCQDSLAFLLLTRGDTPSYRTLCYFRVENAPLIEVVWTALFEVAKEVGLQRLGKITVDSSKFLADASPEAVIQASDYDLFLNTLKTILKEAEEADQNEQNTPLGTLFLEKEVLPDQMREVLRALRKKKNADKRQLNSVQAPKTPATHILSDKPQGKNPAQKEVAKDTPVPQQTVSQKKAALQTKDTPAGLSVEVNLGPRMKPRLVKAIETLETATEQGLKHACLTDPDARMMGEGRDKPIKECHSYEIAVDNGLVIHSEVIQVPDYARLEPAVKAAQANEPGGIRAVDADSGYYKGEAIARLEEQGMDTCVPDGFTAKKLRMGELAEDYVLPVNPMALRYDQEQDVYICAMDKRLVPRQTRMQGGREVRTYRAETPCTGCPLAAQCFEKKKDGKYRTTSRAVKAAKRVDTALSRFHEPQHQQRYHNRGKEVETVFAFLRHILHYTRWMLRGKDRVSAEGILFTSAYQFRKVHCALRQANATV